MQRSRSGDRQPPPRGSGPDLGKEIMKAEHYLTMGKVMELMQETLRMMIAGENHATGVRSAVLPSYEVESSPKYIYIFISHNTGLQKFTRYENNIDNYT